MLAAAQCATRGYVDQWFVGLMIVLVVMTGALLAVMLLIATETWKRN